jgi:hypothetical protein
MDRELEEQIDELINKSTKDLKSKIIRLVVRQQNKLLKEQARELKSNGIFTAPHRNEHTSKIVTATTSSSKGNSSKGNSSKGNSSKGNSSKGNSSKENSSKGNSSKVKSNNTESDSDGYYSD